MRVSRHVNLSRNKKVVPIYNTMSGMQIMTLLLGYLQSNSHVIALI